MENSVFESSVFSLTPEQWQALAPYLFLCLGIFVTTVCAGFKASRGLMKIVTALFLLPYSAWHMMTLAQPAQTVFGTSLEVDALVHIVGAAVGVFALVTSFFASNSENSEPHPEWATLLMTSVLGMSLLPGARDLVAFFVYLETLAITGYIMTSLDTGREKSLEAGLKYLLLGAFASALFLMGATILYGLAGSFDYQHIREAVSNLHGVDATFAVAGATLIASSLLFKVSIMPFHMWAADVYQAAPTSVAAFLATATKLSIFAAASVLFNRSALLGDAFPFVKSYIYVLSCVTIVGGSLMAIAQTHVRRLFAYSGVVNAGYAGLALAAGAQATGSLITNLLIYGGSLICIFAVVEVFAKGLGRDAHSDIEVAELGKATQNSSTLVTALFAFGIFSIAGIPPLPGFFGKYLILKDIWNGGLYAGTWIMLLGTLLGLAYYLRLLVPVFLSQELTRVKPAAEGLRLVMFAATLAALVTVMALGGLNRLPQWIQSVDGFAAR